MTTVPAAPARAAGMPSAADLLPLVERVPALAAPCRHHREEAAIELAVEEWALRSFPELYPARLQAARFGEMASRAFPETKAPEVILFGQWLVWLFVFDDLRDDGPLGWDEAAVDRLYDAVLSSCDTVPPLDAHPVVRAFRDLWSRTAPRGSASWRAMFRVHLAEHRAACRYEARFRSTRRLPSPSEYAHLRRQANGSFLFDLPEPVLGAELPGGLRTSAAWRDLLSACNDVTAWCNDVASAAKESARGDVHNYVLVLAHDQGVSLAAAAAEVLDRIAARIDDLTAAARALPAEFARLDLSKAAARDASKVAMVLLGAPRGHLEWLLESSRYA
ncbi:terpene synthase family protein [Hamadaea sp. NPDC051192]|uniref:terpene synthase family protein n=1 Tax=Hamadaea sp. NPDC051192 TaxID=3154940 RepID=UPI003423D5DE